MAKRVIRPIRIEGNVAYVPLTRGYEAVIDAADAALVSGRNWCAKPTFHKDGRVRSVYAQTFVTKNGKGTSAYIHQIILAADAGSLVDHVDGNGLNNRRCNLRFASLSENQHNRYVNTNSRSGVKGVYWERRNRKWRAIFRAHGRKICVGYFQTITDAKAAIIAARIAYHGQFARS